MTVPVSVYLRDPSGRRGKGAMLTGACPDPSSQARQTLEICVAVTGDKRQLLV
jgi:hypothetical protein